MTRRQTRCTPRQARVFAASAPNTPACGFGTSTWMPGRRHRNRRSRSSGRCTPRASQSSRCATAASTRSGSSRTTPPRPRQPMRMRRRPSMRSSSGAPESLGSSSASTWRAAARGKSPWSAGRARRPRSQIACTRSGRTPRREFGSHNVMWATRRRYRNWRGNIMTRRRI